MALHFALGIIWTVLDSLIPTHAINFNASMIYTNPQICSVFIDPILQHDDFIF